MITMVPEVVATMVVMLIKPFTLFKLSCMAVLRGTFIVMNTWVEILCTSIYFHISVFWRFVVWTVSLITLPARALAALQRVKQLEAQLSELQNSLDALAWDRKKLQEHIQMAIKEHEMLEMALGELEEEHDQAIHKTKLLETELQDLKVENLRLKEFHGKSLWDAGTQVGTGYGYGYGQQLNDTKASDNGVPPWKSNYDRSGVTVANVLMHKDAFEDENIGKFDACEFVKTDGTPMIHQIIPGVMSRSAYLDDTLGQRREAAFSQSLFSALLSLLVGMIIWESEDPCMPLVIALFMVVTMSLKSVVSFFSTIKNKPASDAVALLSLNWFILGTLTYPTLPRVAHSLAPFFINVLERLFGGFLSLSFLNPK